MPKKMPPPPPKKSGELGLTTRPEDGPGGADTGDRSKFSIIGGKLDRPQRVVVYGAGGIGKSTLASLAPKPVFLDIEDGTNDLDVPRVEGITTLSDLRKVLQGSMLDGFETVVLDSATKAEELALRHTLLHVPHEKGSKITSIESYGFGKGYTHLYDVFMTLLQDLDAQVGKGRNVVLIAHECIETVPNPMGDDFIRYEPHLQSPRSGKASIRNRVVQWADHVLFIGYDVVTEDGKGRGAGTRTIWPTELPTHKAKSRRLSDPVDFSDETDGAIWAGLIGKAGK